MEQKGDGKSKGAKPVKSKGLSGILLKKSPKGLKGLKPWQPRFFVYKPATEDLEGVVCYFMDEAGYKKDSDNPKGFFAVSHIKKVTLKSRKNQISILIKGDKKRCISLRAKNILEVKIWVAALTEAAKEDKDRRKHEIEESQDNNIAPPVRQSLHPSKFWSTEVSHDGSVKGLLKKLSPALVMGKEKWQERYCMFQPAEEEGEPSTLSYWKGKNQMCAVTKEPAGVLPCSHMDAVCANPSKGEGRFSIVMKGGRIFEFKATSTKNALRWVQAIKPFQLKEKIQEKDERKNVSQAQGGTLSESPKASTESTTQEEDGKAEEETEDASVNNKKKNNASQKKDARKMKKGSEGEKAKDKKSEKYWKTKHVRKKTKEQPGSAITVSDIQMTRVREIEKEEVKKREERRKQMLASVTTIDERIEGEIEKERVKSTKVEAKPAKMEEIGEKSPRTLAKEANEHPNERLNEEDACCGCCWE